MDKEFVKTYADPNCPVCEGEGYFEVDVNDQPYGSGVHQEERVCECVAEAWQEQQFSISR